MYVNPRIEMAGLCRLDLKANLLLSLRSTYYVAKEIIIGIDSMIAIVFVYLKH